MLWTRPIVIMLAVTLGTALALVVSTDGPTSNGDSARPTGAKQTEGNRARPCRRRFVKREVQQFLRALNTGNQAALEAAVVERGQFPVFSQGLDHRRRPKRFFSADSRADVVAHLMKRAEKGDRARLVSLDTSGSDRSRICNIGYVVWRDIGDRRKPGERFVGKGAVGHEGGLAVWNTGAPKRYFRRR